MEKYDATKELNEVLDMFSKACSTNVPSTSASKPHYNSSSHSKPQQEQYKQQRTSSGQGDYYCVDVPTNVALEESFVTVLGGRSYTVVCPLSMRKDCVDREMRIR